MKILINYNFLNLLGNGGRPSKNYLAPGLINYSDKRLKTDIKDIHPNTDNSPAKDLAAILATLADLYSRIKKLEGK